MKRFVCMLSCCWMVCSMHLAASTTRIWVVDYTGNTVDVIDPATNKVVKTIDTVLRPSGIVISPDGKRAYITSETSLHELAVVDTQTGDIIKKVVLSGRPNLPAVTSDGRLVAVCIRETGPPSPISEGPLHDFHPDNEGRVAKFGGGVDIIDTNTLNIIKTITFDVPLHDCFTSPDGKYVLAGSPEGKFAAAIDLQTLQVAWKVPFDSAVFTMAMEAGPDGSTKRLFVTLEGLNGFAVVDFKTHKQVDTIVFPDISEHGAKVAVMRNKGSTHGSAIAPDGKSLWIANRGSNAVWGYSLLDLKPLGYIHLPEKQENGVLVAGEQDWLTLTPDSKRVYVSNAAYDIVSAIDTKTIKEVARIPVGREPKRIATEVLP
jgi:YVTN family beta-propeller protein